MDPATSPKTKFQCVYLADVRERVNRAHHKSHTLLLHRTASLNATHQHFSWQTDTMSQAQMLGGQLLQRHTSPPSPTVATLTLVAHPNTSSRKASTPLRSLAAAVVRWTLPCSQNCPWTKTNPTHTHEYDVLHQSPHARDMASAPNSPSFIHQTRPIANRPIRSNAARILRWILELHAVHATWHGMLPRVPRMHCWGTVRLYSVPTPQRTQG